MRALEKATVSCRLLGVRAWMQLVLPLTVRSLVVRSVGFRLPIGRLMAVFKKDPCDIEINSGSFNVDPSPRRPDSMRSDALGVGSKKNFTFGLRTSWLVVILSCCKVEICVLKNCITLLSVLLG